MPVGLRLSAWASSRNGLARLYFENDRFAAWPAAVVTVVVVLKKRIARMITALSGRLTKMSAMGVSLEFERGAADVSRAAEELTYTPGRAQPLWHLTTRGGAFDPSG